MTTRVQKWGNSQGVRLSKRMLEGAEIEVGDEVQVSVNDGSIVIRPIHRVRGKYSLRELVARIPKGYRAAEVDWGGPVGEEVW